MWKVVYVASTESEALEIEEKLQDEGYLIRLSADENGFQIKVPESEVEEVYRYIISNLG
ncbi:MAG: hypothetical protein ACOCQ1_03320 [Halanaerobiaceae bacterium]